MSSGRTIFHVVQCHDPEQALWEALVEADWPHKALYGWAPDAWDGQNPPPPVRRALFEGLSAAGGGIIGFTADRRQVEPGSVFRPARQGWLAHRLSPLPGLLWSADAETFDGCFTYRWGIGTQVAFALKRNAPVPEMPGPLLRRWLAKEADDLPPLPEGTVAAVRAGADGGVFAAFGRDARALERFIDGFRAALDWRRTTFQRVLEPQFGPTLVRLSARRATAPPAEARPWYDEVER